MLARISPRKKSPVRQQSLTSFKTLGCIRETQSPIRRLSPVRRRLTEAFSQTDGGMSVEVNPTRNISHTAAHQSLISPTRKSKSKTSKSLYKITYAKAANRLISKMNPKEIETQKIANPFPMSGAEAAHTMIDELTSFEAKEILDFPEVYFLGSLSVKRQPDESCKNYGFDDETGNYLMRPTDHLDYRYEIRNVLGQGSFGIVMDCFDHKRKCSVAVKVVINSTKFRKQSKFEVAIIEALNKASNSPHIVRMKACFSFRGHICIVFERLGPNLYQLSKINLHQGFPTLLVKKYSQQIVSALSTMHSLGLVHCDLKPENILASDLPNNQIKLIDFGSSCYDTQTTYTYLQSRYYRAPEVILGLPYGCSIDMWSLGCIIAELVNGRPIFEGDSEADQLLAITEVLGLPPKAMLENSPKTYKFFKTFSEPIISPNKSGVVRRPEYSNLASEIRTSEFLLLDFLRKCLQWDPAERLTVEEAQRHPWLDEDLD